jgi:manganese efflux pump family protein
LDWLQILGIAVGLAMDAFAVSIAAGLSIGQVTPRHVFRLAFHFGLFQFLMPVLGWMAGERLANAIGQYDHWVAFALLAGVGGKMLWEAWENEEDESPRDPTKGLMLITLSVATSLDALAVGFSMALLNVRIWVPSVVIGIVAAALTAVGILSGGRLGARWERIAEVVGGCVLIAIGVRIVIGHL